MKKILIVTLVALLIAIFINCNPLHAQQVERVPLKPMNPQGEQEPEPRPPEVREPQQEPEPRPPEVPKPEKTEPQLQHEPEPRPPEVPKQGEPS